MASCLWPVLLLATVGTTDLNLVYFTASWCQPCAQMQPTLEKLHAEGVTIHIVDADQQPQAIRNYQIENLPTLVFVSQGREVDRMVGVADYTQVKRRVDRALARSQGPSSRSASPMTAAASNPESSRSASGAVVRGQSPNLPVSSGAVTAASLVASRSSGPQAAAASAPANGLTPEQAVARAAAATVRIRVDEGNTTAHGTGTIVDVHGQEALVLTCGHLFRDMQPGTEISVDLFAGTPQEVNRPAQLVDYQADETDIGLISFVLPVAVEPVEILPRGQQPQAGQTAFSFGCDHGANPTRRDTQITNINRYLGAANIEIHGAPAVGRSGGGLFDLQGRLIGVCNAADANDDRGIYAGADVVYAQIERLQLTHLFESPSASTPALLANHARASAEPAQASASALPPAAQTGLAGHWPDAQLATAEMPDLTGPANPAATATPHEVICIVRDASGQRVLTINNPSPELMRQLQSHPQR